MKLSKLFVTALLVGTLAVVGCGDDGGGGDGGSNGGTGGTNGGGDPCNVGECVNDSNRKRACEVSFAACSTLPQGTEVRRVCEEASVTDQCFDAGNI